jgi:hypothetical protein
MNINGEYPDSYENAFPVTPTTFTIGIIFKEITSNASDHELFGITYSAAGHRIRLFSNSGNLKIIFQIRASATQNIFSITDFKDNGLWNLIIVSYNMTTKTLRFFESGNVQEVTNAALIDFNLNLPSNIISNANQNIWRNGWGELFCCPSFCDTATANLYAAYYKYHYPSITWVDVP